MFPYYIDPFISTKCPTFHFSCLKIMLSNIVATTLVCLFNLKDRQVKNFSFSVALVTFQVLRATGLVATQWHSTKKFPLSQKLLLEP